MPDQARQDERQPRLEEAIVQASIEARIRTKRAQHISSGRLSGSRANHCLRRLTYYLGSYPREEPTARQLWIMQVGQLIHQYIQECLVQSNQVQVQPDGRPGLEWHVEDPSGQFHGYIDAVLTDGSIVEIKTVATSKLASLVRPLDWHLPQASLYAHWKRASLVRFVYVGTDARTGYEGLEPDQLPVRELSWQPEPGLAEHVLTRFWKAVRYQQQGQLGPREYTPVSPVSQCHQCEYRPLCYPEASLADGPERYDTS